MTTACHASIRQCAYQGGEADLVAISALVNTCEAVDRLEQGTSVAELRESYADPSFDPTQDLRLWRDAVGQLVAVAELWRLQPLDTVSAYLCFSVHPAFRRGSLEAEVLAWAERRLWQVAEGSALPVELQISVRESQRDRIAFLEGQGFKPVRHFYRMRRDLTAPIPQPQLPVGFTLRQVNPERDAEAWVDLFNQSFIDHWNHHPMTVELFHYYSALSTYDPTLDLVAEAAEGTLVAFCGGEVNGQANARTNRKEGWIAVLGTRRGYRRQGLGRALLLAQLQRLQALNLEAALLAVDTVNPSGALGLYTSVGFEQVHRTTAFSKRLRGA